MEGEVALYNTCLQLCYTDVHIAGVAAEHNDADSLLMSAGKASLLAAPVAVWPRAELCTRAVHMTC